MPLEQKPVIFVATANDRVNPAQYLRNLPEEQRCIRATLERAEVQVWCEYVHCGNATLDDILAVFRDRRYRDRIAVFHYAGHADSYDLMLETVEGNPHLADGRGLADFLAQQKGLRLVFLNACSTAPQVEQLLAANVPAVIATSKAVNDETAKHFAVNFYQSLAVGGDLKRAFDEAEAAIKTATGNKPRQLYVKKEDALKLLMLREGEDDAERKFVTALYESLEKGRELEEAFCDAEAAGNADTENKVRHLFVISNAAPQTRVLPWKLETCKKTEEKLKPGEKAGDATAWNLPDSVDDYLWDLPLPEMDLPQQPFRHLNWFEREHAGIFFGRGQQIRQLYKAVVAADAAPIILLYGQSGVGKSSLLAAGLLPRLEASYDVHYLRRQQSNGLLKTCLDNLQPDAEPSAVLKRLWAQAEAADGKPVVLLLDQVEEVFTRPNLATPDELNELCAALQEVFEHRAERPRGKIILSFRKEWLPEIEQKLTERNLLRGTIFIERLDEKGALEAITGITKTERLRKQYNLKIEDGLAAKIVIKLMEDQGSPLATTLQILLSEMWGKAVETSRSEPEFNEALYDEEVKEDEYDEKVKKKTSKKKTSLLDKFLDQQLERLKDGAGEAQPAEIAEVTKSGLTLDVLAFHTTELGTAEQRSAEDLAREYAHRKEVLPKLTQRLKDLYLLTDPPLDQTAGDDATRLAHDTLAPLVRARFDKSPLPGQRARRILENRGKDWLGGKTGAPLDNHDLSLVKHGLTGMRTTKPDEKRLIKASRRRAYIWKTVGVLTVCLISFVVWKFIKYRESQAILIAREIRARNEVDSRRLITESQDLKSKGKNKLAILRAKRAVELAPIEEADAMLRRLLTVEISGHSIFSPDGKYLITSSKNNLHFWDTLTELPSDFAGDARLSSSSDGRMILTCNYNEVDLWDISELQSRKLILKITSDDLKSNIRYADISSDGNLILIVQVNRKVVIWDRSKNEFKDVSNWNNFPDIFEKNKNQWYLIRRINFLSQNIFIMVGKKRSDLCDAINQTCKQIPPSAHNHEVFFSPDKKYIATYSKELSETITSIPEVLVWNIEKLDKPEYRFTLPAHSSTDRVDSIPFAITPDNKSIVLFNNDKSLDFYNLNTQKTQKTESEIIPIGRWSVNRFYDRYNFPWDTTFSPNGKTLLLRSFNVSLLLPCKICGFTEADLISLAKSRASQLSDDEKN